MGCRASPIFPSSCPLPTDGDEAKLLDVPVLWYVPLQYGRLSLGELCRQVRPVVCHANPHEICASPIFTSLPDYKELNSKAAYNVDTALSLYDLHSFEMLWEKSLVGGMSLDEQEGVGTLAATIAWCGEEGRERCPSLLVAARQTRTTATHGVSLLLPLPTTRPAPLVQDTKCLIGWSDRTLVVAFRGTASIANVASDLQVLFLVCEKWVRVRASLTRDRPAVQEARSRIAALHTPSSLTPTPRRCGAPPGPRPPATEHCWGRCGAGPACTPASCRRTA